MMLYEKIKKKFRLSLYSLCAVLAFSSTSIYGDEDIDAVLQICQELDKQNIDDPEKPEKKLVDFAIDAKKYVIKSIEVMKDFFKSSFPGPTEEELAWMRKNYEEYSTKLDEMQQKCLSAIHTEKILRKNFWEKKMHKGLWKV